MALIEKQEFSLSRSGLQNGRKRQKSLRTLSGSIMVKYRGMTITQLRRSWNLGAIRFLP
ncbi:MAG: hypothetical protein ACRC10_06480 [Thermoguttaceae bacterium]